MDVFLVKMFIRSYLEKGSLPIKPKIWFYKLCLWVLFVSKEIMVNVNKTKMTTFIKTKFNKLDDHSDEYW